MSCRYDKKYRKEKLLKQRVKFISLGCRDFARIDFRIGNNKQLYFIEINRFRVLRPHNDYPMLAVLRINYEYTYMRILNAAVKRYG